MTNPSGRVALLAIVALLSLPSATLAQSASAPASVAPSAQVPSNNSALERVEARIKQLHVQLRITPAEEPQWNQFAQTMRDNAREIDEAAQQRSQQYPTMTAMQNLDSYEKLAEAHVQRLQKLIPAFKDLYDVMPADQKQLVDQVFRARAQERSGRDQHAQYHPGHRSHWYYRGYHHRWWAGYSPAEELNSEELARLAGGR